MHTWREAQQAGITLYVTKTGEIRMKDLKNAGLHPAALDVLRAHKPTIVAEWLWTSPKTPAVLQWDEPIADAVLAFAARLMAHPHLYRLDDAADIHQAEAAVDWAFNTQQLVAVFEAAKTWVLAVADHARPAEITDSEPTNQISLTETERRDFHGSSTHQSPARSTRDIA